MIRRINIIILILLTTISTYANRHWIGISPLAFTSWQLDDALQTTPAVGAGGGIGVNYLFQKRYFILELGAECTYNYHRTALEDNRLSYPMLDTKGEKFIYHALIANRQDYAQNIALRIPLMVGAEFRYFYFSAGAKLHLNLEGKSHSKASLTTWGDYDIFYDDVFNMPDQGFFPPTSIQNTHSIKLGFDLRPSIELGAVIYDSLWKNKMHLGIYAEYGLLNTLPRERNSQIIEVDLSQYMQVWMNNIYTTSIPNNLHHLSIGLRFTYYLELNNGDNCRCVYY